MKRGIKMKRGVIIFLMISMFSITISMESSYNSRNLEIEIPIEYQSVFPGEKVWFTTRIFNLANDERRDIILQYTLEDTLEKVITSKSETVAIETQASFVGNLDIPQNIPIGKYFLKVEILGESKNEGISRVSLTISERKSFANITENNKKQILFIISTILLGVIFFVLRKRIKTKFKEFFLNEEVKKVIKEKLRNGKITQKDLENSKLPSTNNSKKSEEKIF